MQSVWTEKYRPSTFEQVKGQKRILERIQAMVNQKNLQNMLFCGPAGVGKSTLAVVIARELFGENWKFNFHELNASDARGIDVVRNDIKQFARTKAIGTELPKIIFLDECDALTKEAQQALRRTMENYSKTVRFVLSCNFFSKILDPIKSRCTIFKFKPLEKEDVEKVVFNLAEKEGLNVSKETIDALYDVCEGDARRIVNILQSCAMMDKNISTEHVFEFMAMAKPEEIKSFLIKAINKDFINAKKEMQKVMIQHSLSGMDLIKQIQKEIWSLEIDDNLKIKLIDKCGEIEFRMVEGSDEFIQLEALLANFANAHVD